VISPIDQQRLLALARRVLDAKVRRTTIPDCDVEIETTSGAFVSIFRHGELRGCLGRLNPGLPLAETVMQLAQAVADSDPRFERVAPWELDSISLEISVLTPEWEVTSINEIEIGRHGLIVEQGLSRGLLLPQVATEMAWDRDTFLNHACLKAGLPAEAWKRGARIFIFEADVFGERVSRSTH